MEERWTWVALIGVVALIGLGVVAKTFNGIGSPSQITLVNRSAETVAEAHLRQGDQETKLGSIEPGRMRSADFITREGSLTLTVRFGSGRTISANNVGYTVAAIPVIVYFTVDDNKVELLDITNSNPYRLF